MTLLSAADIADLTALDVSGMPDTCTITTTTQVPDGGGGQTETTTTATAICRFVARTGREISDAQLREQGDYLIYLPKATVIANTARVTFGARTFIVIWTPPNTGYSTSRVVGLKDA
jgi:Phage head-tail joining protein